MSGIVNRDAVEFFFFCFWLRVWHKPLADVDETDDIECSEKDTRFLESSGEKTEDGEFN